MEVGKTERKNYIKRSKTEWVWTVIFIVTFLAVVGILLTLCADEGIDYDEAYSFHSARDYTQFGIVKKMIDDYDTDVPLYYNALRVWILLFGGIGHRFFAARCFSVAGTVASMILGVTVIRKHWGNMTALFFMIAVALAPAMLHVSVNIRMYSWTNFLVTASAVLIYELAMDPDDKKKWVLLGLCTVAGLFTHYFTAFAFAFLYLYLLIALFRDKNGRRSVWKVFVCGGVPVAALSVWVILSGFLHLVNTDTSEVEIKGVALKQLFYYLFQTDMKFDLIIGGTLVAAALTGAVILMRKERGEKRDAIFACTCVLVIFLSYIAGRIASSFASHFFIARHIMHSAGIMWLGIAIVFPKINLRVYLAGLAVLTSICYSNYMSEYESAYRDTPYMEETKEFIATQMEPGDIVIYSTEKKYYRLYKCYMPDQEFMWLWEMSDEEIAELAGKRVWYFSTNWKEYFTDEQVEKYGISAVNMGHYGFQIMDNCADFDLLRLEIGGAR